MAYIRKLAEALQGPALIVMALILFTATADAQLRPPIIVGPILPPIVNFTGLNVTGRVCCTPNGNCLPGSLGVPGVVVGLICTNLAGVSVWVGQGTTNVNGNFSIIVPSQLLPTLGNTLPLSSQIPCNISIPLPLNKTLCPILNTTEGVLTGIPSVLTGVTQGLFGLLGIFSVPLLTLNAMVQV